MGFSPESYTVMTMGRLQKAMKIATSKANRNFSKHWKNNRKAVRILNVDAS